MDGLGVGKGPEARAEMVGLGQRRGPERDGQIADQGRQNLGPGIAPALQEMRVDERKGRVAGKGDALAGGV